MLSPKRRWRSTRTHVTVVAGPGNNGGDGFVAARILAERAYRTTVLLVGDRERLRRVMRRLPQAGGADKSNRPRPKRSHQAVSLSTRCSAPDSIALSKALPRAIIEAMNNASSHVIAVDLPSGISGDTGAVMGAAVKARQSVTFFRKKPGHLLMPGRQHCGDVSGADIGIRSDVLEAIQPPDVCERNRRCGLARFQCRVSPGTSIHAVTPLVVSGGMSFTGAALARRPWRITGRGGLVTIVSPRDALAVHAASNTAVMVREVDGAEALTRSCRTVG